MKKKLFAVALTAAMTAAMGMTSFAGQWLQNDTGWWWAYDDGTNPVNEWLWLDGNQDGIYECYYFGSDGYMYANRTTPDGYQVNSDGAWIVDGGVQLKYEEDMSTDSEDEEDYSYSNYDRENLVGSYEAEDGSFYELFEGEGTNLAAFYYDDDGDMTIYNLERVSDTVYRTATGSRTITFVDENTFSVNNTLYYR